MRNADLFVFPSLNEGFGMPPLEAMACGTPVITSNTSSLPEVVADAGILIDPYNVDEMAGAIARVISNRELRVSMGRKGLEQARLFSWGKAARDMLDTIAEVSVR
jgi:glycosyltransferase involved in cell wall biosynthesis